MQLNRALWIVAAAIATTVPEVRAQVDPTRTAEGSLRIYADDDHVTVVTPSASVRAPLARSVAVDATATIDVVTAASIDVTSQASPYPFHEQRVEGDVGVTWAPTSTIALSARAVASVENDYRSLHLGCGLHLEGARHDALLDLAYTAAIDEVGRVGDPAFARPRRGHRLVAALTRVLDPRTILDLVLDGEAVSGYQASPYRYVPIVNAGGNRLYSLAEATPDLRLRGAALARVRRAFGSRLFLHLDYRYYLDSWAIQSHTASARLLVTVGNGRVTLAGEARGYLQSGASFYRPSYLDDGTGPPEWRTRDRALGRVRSVTGGLGADIALSRRPFADATHLLVAVEVIRFFWLDYPLQSGRTAVVPTLGVSAPF